MTNPYLLNIIGLVLEIIGVIYVGSFLIIIKGNPEIRNRAFWIGYKIRGGGGTETEILEPFERGFMNVGLVFLFFGLCFQIYANYLQGRI